MSTAANRWTPASAFALTVLLLVLALSTNLQVQTLLLEPIRIDLGLTDTQLGRLQGLVVVLFGTLAAFPIGWAADQWDRRRVLALCVLCWSAAIYIGGMASSFGGLQWAMVGLAIGESALLPLVYALTPQVVPASRLPLANALVFAALTLSGGLALMAGGMLYPWVDANRVDLPWLDAGASWRVMFFITGLLGLPVALLLLFVRYLPQPGNAAGVRSTPDDISTSPRKRFGPFLRQHGLSLAGVYIGLSCPSIAWMLLMMWMPTILRRTFDMDVGAAGVGFGTVTTAATIVGVTVALWWMSRSKAGNPAIRSYRLLRTGYGLAIVPVVLAAFVPGLPALGPSGSQVLLLLAGLAVTFLVIGASQSPTLLQQVAPLPFLSRSIALLPLVALPLRGSLPPVVGALSDWFGVDSPAGLLHATVMVMVLLLLLGSALLYLLENRYLTMIAVSRGFD